MFGKKTAATPETRSLKIEAIEEPKKRCCVIIMIYDVIPDYDHVHHMEVKTLVT
jgi:hypothetical protein